MYWNKNKESKIMKCNICNEPGQECGFTSNEVCTTIVCEKHRHTHVFNPSDGKFVTLKSEVIDKIEQAFD